jgi:hypothetical protein
VADPQVCEIWSNSPCDSTGSPISTEGLWRPATHTHSF